MRQNEAGGPNTLMEEMREPPRKKGAPPSALPPSGLPNSGRVAEKRVGKGKEDNGIKEVLSVVPGREVVDEETGQKVRALLTPCDMTRVM